jgi:glucose-1-phosphate thymidylyltransferase
MKALILAGGKGTRLRPLTFSRQKQIIPVADKEIIAYVIEDIKEAGITDIGVVTGGALEGTLKEHVGDGSRWGVRITYVEQPEALGLAHAVKCAREFLGDDSFIMYLGDNLFKEGIKGFVENFNNTDSDAMILLTHVKHPEQCGLCYLNEDGSVNRLVEKPSHPETDLGIVGVYAFKPAIFEAIGNIQPSARGELEITDAISWLVDNGKKVSTSMVSGWWEDTGNHCDLLEANQLLLNKIELKNLGTIEEGVEIEGNVGIGQNTVVKSGSRIIGPCVIGDNCEIKGCVGPYTSIGNDVKLVDGCIENSIVLDGCYIDIRKKIVRSLIGAECKVLKAESDQEIIMGDKSIVKL